MRENTKKALELLSGGGFTCVLYNGERMYTDTKRGVAPLLQLLESKESLSGFCAADKVVGAGAAYLYVLLDVCEVYAFVISEKAKDILLSHGISVHQKETAAHIINRKGDGVCPIELAVADATDAKDALIRIKKRLGELNSETVGK